MFVTLGILVAVSMAWAVVALAIQVLAAWGGGRREYGRRAGSPGRGVLYSFTAAMLPARKEAIRLHPVEFSIGLVRHAVVGLAMLGVITLVIRSASRRPRTRGDGQTGR